MEIYSIVLTIYIGILGLCFGSFASVLISRTLNQEKGIVKGKSHCPDCHHQLMAIDLVPLFSFLFNKAKCRYCKKKISWFYPALELTSAALFLFSFLTLSHSSIGWQTDFGSTWLGTPGQLNLFSLSFWAILIYLFALNLNLIAIVFSDLKEKAIPNSFLISWVLLSAFSLFFTWPLDPFNLALAIAAICLVFGGQILISKGKWLGSGDFYFGLGMAFLLGFEKTLVAIVLSYFIGSIISLFLLATKVLTRKSTLPFTPFLALATLISLYFGNQIWLWYTSFSFINL
jgi:prepilin signal peptidase PulO-like enzyme (type II secretory pathway)